MKWHELFSGVDADVLLDGDEETSADSITDMTDLDAHQVPPVPREITPPRDAGQMEEMRTGKRARKDDDRPYRATGPVPQNEYADLAYVTGSNFMYRNR